jgi:hypothetical protein
MITLLNAPTFWTRFSDSSGRLEQQLLSVSEVVCTNDRTPVHYCVRRPTARRLGVRLVSSPVLAELGIVAEADCAARRVSPMWRPGEAAI